ncbi:hypothetical protein ACTHGU_00235 [Chitinophagaceae bacterium MMS25-I14]
MAYGLRYTIEPGKVTLQPKFVLVVLSIVIAVIFLVLQGIMFFLVPGGGMSLFFIFTVIVFMVPLLIGLQKAVFDGASHTFYRSILGYQFGKIPFADIAHVSTVTHTGMSTGEHFKLAPKNNIHGAGVTLSLAYRKNAKQYKIWTSEIMPAINGMLKTGAMPVVNVQQVVTDFTFYKNDGSNYTAFTLSGPAQARSALLGAGLIAIGVFGFKTNFDTGKDMLYVAGFIIVGVILFSTTFNKIVITATEVSKIRFFGLYKTKRPISSFINFLVLRSRTNGIYTGTEVIMQCKGQSNLVLRNFYSTKNIDRFMLETRTAMGLLR